MAKRPQIFHLVDDTTPGGVMRVIEYIRSNDLLSASAKHIVQPVCKGKTLSDLRADVIISHLSINWRALPALIALRARRGNAPLIHVEHSYTESFTALNVRNKPRFFTLLRSAYALFDEVIAVSNAQANWMWRRELVQTSSLRVISPMVDLSHLRTLPPPSWPPVSLGAIGRLDVQKGFDLLIDAFRQLKNPDIQLSFFGDGPERARLVRLAQNDKRILFCGHIAKPETAYASVDAVVMPSRWEAYGLVALEARSARRPLLMSQVDGLTDQITDGCLAIRQFTPGAWHDALSSLISGDVPVPAGLDGAALEAEFAAQWSQLLASVCPDMPWGSWLKQPRPVEIVK